MDINPSPVFTQHAERMACLNRLAIGEVVASIVIRAVVATGPIGWGVTLVASSVGSYFSQEAGNLVGKSLFDQFGKEIDLAETIGVTRIFGVVGACAKISFAAESQKKRNFYD